MPSKYPSVTAQAKGNSGRPNYRPTPRIPTPANDNKIGVVRSSAGRAGAKIGGRVLSRFIPYVGWGLALYDVYQGVDWLIQQGSTAETPENLNPDKWTITDHGCEPGEFWKFVYSSSSPCFKVGVWDWENPYTEWDGSHRWFHIFERQDGNWPEHSWVYRAASVSPKPGTDGEPNFISSPGYAIPLPRNAPSPLATPFAFQAPFADPKVWEAPKVGEEPANQPKKKKKGQRPPNPAPHVMPEIPWPWFEWPDPFTMPNGDPVTHPGTVVVFDPDTGEGIVERDPDVIPKDEPFSETIESGDGTSVPPTDAPPKKQTQPRRWVEGKTNYRTGVKVLVWAGINTWTEAQDFAIAMHDSITNRSYKLNDKASRAQVVEYMFTNIEPWQHIGLAQGLENFLNMQIGDFVAALGSEAIKKGSRGIGVQTGLDRVLRVHEDNLEEIDDDSDGEFEGWRGKVPEIDIDPDTWEVRLRWK